MHNMQSNLHTTVIQLMYSEFSPIGYNKSSPDEGVGGKKYSWI